MSAEKITSREEIDRLIGSCLVCRVAVTADSEPYIIPFSFGYDGGSIYIHTGAGGRKIAAFERSPRVCFEFEQGVRVIENGENPCGWSFSFASVIGYGRITELAGDGKIAGLNRIMEHYSGRRWKSFRRGVLEKTRVWRIEIETISGRRNRRR
jgi:hypothetical protein